MLHIHILYSLYLCVYDLALHLILCLVVEMAVVSDYAVDPLKSKSCPDILSCATLSFLCYIYLSYMFNLSGLQSELTVVTGFVGRLGGGVLLLLSVSLFVCLFVFHPQISSSADYLILSGLVPSSV